jgi:hypothetical protein
MSRIRLTEERKWHGFMSKKKERNTSKFARQLIIYG